MSLPEGDCVAGCTTATSGCAAFVLQQTLDNYGYVNSTRCVRYSQPLPSSLPLPGLTAPSLPSAVGVGAEKGPCTGSPVLQCRACCWLQPCTSYLVPMA